MEYLFLRRKKTRLTSVRQKTLLYRAASCQWEREFASQTDVRPIDGSIYKGILYLLEVRQVFLDSSLSLKVLSAMLETNQTYLSQVVNRYFGCNLKELVNRYRVEYAKELLRSGRCPMEEVPVRSGFGSKSPFYVAFGKVTGMTPRQYVARKRNLPDLLEMEQDNKVLL
ncbi:MULTISPECIES: AraC family transcriptional regulator [Bacteroidaceae]|uniref:helix-turn-helix domain-containing protein n=1 Tax=Bacteroidaceae TaxID=815 RepID=UPI0023D53419|nr:MULTISPECIES: AraC family transcriptional regulator [Bacteroidaceae]MDE6799877.1 AraC family transcriptional regulator [Phocaeicola sp.]